MQSRRNAISCLVKADILCVAIVSELANELEEGILILVLVLQVDHAVAVAVILNVETELVDMRSL